MSETNKAAVSPQTTLSPVLQRLQERFADKVLMTHSFRGDDTAVIERESALDVFRFLKEESDLAFNMLIDLTAVDRLYLNQTPRFEVVCHLYSMTHRHRVRIKIPVPESDAEVDSLTGLWAIANWYEREVWDMFGIRFRGHPDLRRILMYEEFEGHPLRKNYPKQRRQPLVKVRIEADVRRDKGQHP